MTPVDELTARQFSLATPLTRQALELAQLQRLRTTIAGAVKHSPFYRTHLSSLSPAAITSLEDLQNLPLLDADQVRAAGESLLCVSRSRVARVVTLQTSGSTGLPKRLAFSAADLERTLAFFRYGMQALVSSADRVLVLLPWELPDSVGDLLLRALRRDGLYAIGHWPPHPFTAAAELLRRDRITCAVGLPQHLLALATVAGPTRLRSVLLCSDYAAPSVRRRIELLAGCATFLHYGTTESGLGGGVECYCHDGCHLREADLLVEIIDPDNGRPVADGHYGEIVLTTLGRQAMPLIRYRTGDGARLSRETCRCGGITARLYEISGRLGVVTLADGTALSSRELDDLLFDIPDLLDYRITLEAASRDRLRLDYLAYGPAAGIDKRIVACLQAIPAIQRSCDAGLLSLGPIQRVPEMTAHHTVKRTILDLRPSGAPHALHPR